MSYFHIFALLKFRGNEFVDACVLVFTAPEGKRQEAIKAMVSRKHNALSHASLCLWKVAMSPYAWIKFISCLTISQKLMKLVERSNVNKNAP